MLVELLQRVINFYVKYLELKNVFQYTIANADSEYNLGINYCFSIKIMKSIAMLTSFLPKKMSSVLKHSRKRDKSLNQLEYKRINCNMLSTFTNFSLRLFSIACYLNILFKIFLN